MIFRAFAAKIPRPFSVCFNPYNCSIEVLDSKDRLQQYTRRIKGMNIQEIIYKELVQAVLMGWISGREVHLFCLKIESFECLYSICIAQSYRRIICRGMSLYQVTTLSPTMACVNKRLGSLPLVKSILGISQDGINQITIGELIKDRHIANT